MDEQRMTGETGDKNAVIDRKLRQFFDGKIVRKDLTKKIKEGANVPVYVLEFLLGQYCSSDDPEVIETGVENVKRILADNYVRPDEAQKLPVYLQRPPEGSTPACPLLLKAARASHLFPKNAPVQNIVA